jgi:hypothetical protein
VLSRWPRSRGPIRPTAPSSTLATSASATTRRQRCSRSRRHEFVGTIGSWTMEGDRQVSYWIDPARWGQGLASRALRAFLAIEPTRPLYGRVAGTTPRRRRCLLGRALSRWARKRPSREESARRSSSRSIDSTTRRPPRTGRASIARCSWSVSSGHADGKRVTRRLIQRGAVSGRLDAPPQWELADPSIFFLPGLRRDECSPGSLHLTVAPEVDGAGGQRRHPSTSTGLTPTRVTRWAAAADHTMAVPATAR